MENEGEKSNDEDSILLLTKIELGVRMLQRERTCGGGWDGGM